MLITVGIACAAIALLTLMVVVTQKLIASKSAGTGSLAPRAGDAGDASEELEGTGPVPAGDVSGLDREKILLDDLGQPLSLLLLNRNSPREKKFCSTMEANM
jgi:hypothetical protein